MNIIYQYSFHKNFLFRQRHKWNVIYVSGSVQFFKPRENPASSVLDIVYSCLQLEQIAVFRSLLYFKSGVNLSGEHVLKQIKTKNGKRHFIRKNKLLPSWLVKQISPSLS